jgi:UDPglucose 6-dehydrogenase|tara:strand:+ start:136 stop:882 length:747 start_codon:yes stop_codon:yes gene_type:complete
MKIGIAGYGFVGKAHHNVLKSHHDIEIYDPALKYKNFNQPDAVIICVSTPQGSHGGCHMDNVYDVVRLAPNVPILIKSTISLEGWQTLKHMFPNNNFTFSPEFLRADTALQDFANTKEIMMGGDDVTFWANLFTGAMDVNVNIFKPEELILIKYFRNSFLATKVAFFNQISDLCKVTNIDYKIVSEYIGADERIGKSHTQVTSERGFGGHCFPKDTFALVTTAKKNGYNLSILQEAINYNNSIRKDDT